MAFVTVIFSAFGLKDLSKVPLVLFFVLRNNNSPITYVNSLCGLRKCWRVCPYLNLEEALLFVL